MDQYPADNLGETRRGGAGRTFFVGVLCFLLGAVAAGWIVWTGALGHFRPYEFRGAPAAGGRPDVEPPGGTAPPPASNEAVAALATEQGGMDSRLAALEQRIARLDLQAAAVEGQTARAEALLVAFAARRALERGAPLGYLADQLRLRFGDAKPNSVALVIDAANHPVTVDKLVARLNSLGPELREADDATGFGWIREQLGDLFIVRHQSAPSPEPRKRLDRARLFLESGRVDAAVAEVKNMPGAEKAHDWIVDAERFARAQEALDLLETSAVLDTRVLKDGAGQPVS